MIGKIISQGFYMAHWYRDAMGLFSDFLFLPQEEEEARESKGCSDADHQGFSQINYEQVLKEFSCYTKDTKQPLNTLDVSMP